MNLAFAVTLVSAILSAFLAAIGHRLSRARIWRDLDRFWPVAAFTALFALLDLGSFLPIPVGTAATLARLQLATAPLLAFGWLRYSAIQLDGAEVPGERRLGMALAALSALVAVPGVAFDATSVHAHRDPLLGNAWTDPVLTPFGHAAAAVAVGVAAWSVGRMIQAWRRGNAAAGVMVAAVGCGTALAVFDYAGRVGGGPAAHLLSPIAALPVATAAWLVAVRFARDADALHELRGRLEGLVEERTRELAETHSALLQAEKLAALGQFAAGVAHEVNNPASVVTSNLTWLSNGTADALASGEAKEVVGESLEAMHRINELVRKLLDAGRLADLPPGSGNVALRSEVDRSFAELRAKSRLDVELVNHVPDDVLVRGVSDVVGRIVTNLVSNGVDAIPNDRRGRVEVRALVDGARVRLIVEDDGAGMNQDVLRRVFDPFFTTKPPGRGNGLGLPITRGLVEGIGGEIWLESEPGKGTRAAVELALATPA
ncbi:MAG TPA: ATP-binding protein [Anaeromyxobacteraceae bacterium]|nr:ATP-binding protein [Anaeromyxobacteraceae bacterium]